jgi:hypothetical protein
MDTEGNAAWAPNGQGREAAQKQMEGVGRGGTMENRLEQRSRAAETRSEGPGRAETRGVGHASVGYTETGADVNGGAPH